MINRFRSAVPRGVVAGVLGATAIAFWFLIIDGSQGQPFRTPGFLAGVMLFVAFEAFFMGLMALAAEFLLGPLAWWAIAVGNLLASVALGWYLWVKHPKLQKVLAERPLDKPD